MSASGAPSGALAANVMHFARVLRAAGLPLGTAEVMDALRALAVIDLGRRDDFEACLRAVFVRRREHLELFEQAFRLFFRDPLGAETALSLLLSKTDAAPPPPADVSRRVAEALRPDAEEKAKPRPPDEDRLEVDALLAWSDEEALRTKDFAEMSAEELRRAREIVARMHLDVKPVPTRRTRPAPRGRVDLRATLRASLRSGGHDIPLRFRRRREEAPPLVVICDISGSMGRYTEMLLRFMHLVANDRDRVRCFLFGTRLTNVTRALRHRDVDVALKKCGLLVTDWSGGTRIGACLDEFNRRWSRRVLGQGAIVLLISDGLEREAAAGLAAAAERLQKSCRRLIWLNPLLRYARFEPKAQGVRAILPHVDDFRPVHDLESLEGLAAALGATSASRRRSAGRGS